MGCKCLFHLHIETKRFGFTVKSGGGFSYKAQRWPKTPLLRSIGTMVVVVMKMVVIMKKTNKKKMLEYTRLIVITCDQPRDE